MRILVVEDHEMTAEILRVHLEKHGFDVILASNGVEALECLESARDVSLVVTDLLMPEMDGFELLSNMNQRLDLSEIPVIVVSARAEPEVVKRAAELGCRQFLVKPVDDNTLVKAVRAALNVQRDVLRPQHEITEQLGIDPQTYKKLVERFVAIATEAITKLEEGLADGGAAETSPLRAEFLRLMEAAQLLGAERLAQAAARLATDQAPSDGQDDTSRRRLLLREIAMLLSTMRSRSLPVQARSESLTHMSASANREREPVERGRTFEIKKRIVRVP